jgi:hypothetical protein
MALDVEGVEDSGVNGQEALGWSGRFETLHLALAPSCRLVRILGPIVLAQPWSWRADNPISDFAAP